MPEAFAKFRVGTPGSGAVHAALEPYSDRNKGSQLELNLDEMSIAAALGVHLNDRALDQSDVDVEADLVWTWNPPSDLTGDNYSIQQGNTLIDNIAGHDTASDARLT